MNGGKEKIANLKKNYLYNLAYTLFNTILPLITAPYLARVVGKNNVGIYGYFYSIAYMFYIGAKLGLNNYGTREISKARERGNLDETFSSIFYQQIITALVAIIVYFMFCIFVFKDFIALILGLTVVGGLFDIDWLFSGLESFKQISRKNIIVKIITVILIFVFVKKGDDLDKYTLIMSMGTLIGFLAMWINLRQHVKLIRVPVKRILIHLKPNFILVLPVLALSVYRYMDKIMLGLLSDFAETGIYEYSEKIIFALCGFINSFGTVMMPRMANLIASGKKKESNIYIYNSLSFMMLLIWPMAFGLLEISNDLALVLFGQEFQKCGTLMMLLGFTLPMMGWSNVIRTQYEIPREKDKFFLFSVSTGAIINIIVNGIMIPKYGALGAVYGTLCAELSVPIAQFIMLRRELPYRRLITTILIPFFSGVTMYFIIHIVGVQMNLNSIIKLAIQIIVGMMVYIIVVIILLKLFNKKLLNNIMSIVKGNEK